MSIYALKPRFQAWLRPGVQTLFRLGVSANQVTWFACIGSIALGAWMATNAHQHVFFLLLSAWFLIRMALNAIDGMLAREYGQRSALGAYLNEVTDVVSDAALYLPFAFLAGVDAWTIALVIWLACLSELAGVLGLAVGAERRNDGPMGKSDRALVFGGLGLVMGAGVAPGEWISWVMIAVSAFTAVTVVNRVRHGIASSRDARRQQ
jgi:CDP-diacylglycerol--glycerol-3-phosphate 3-phosphatidyltransferase